MAGNETRQSTVADAGWRAGEERSGRQATVADAGWRAGEERNGRQATVADAGWRAGEERSGRQVTMADAGWRSGEIDILNPINLMESATANAFSSIDAFREAVSNQGRLVSMNGLEYAVKYTISSIGGESVILLCAAPDGTDVVAKVYFKPVNSAGSSTAARNRVLEYMKTDAGQKYTLPVIDIGLVECEGSKYYFEVMPYCKEGDLFTPQRPFSFDEIVQLTSVLNEAIHSLHEAGIIHRDIKPENLYRYEDRVVIGDFGVAILANEGVTATTAGTDFYRAPESVLAVTAGKTAFYFDEKSDYYSLGVTLGSLFEGHLVFEGLEDGQITMSVRNGRLPLKQTDTHRDELENLLNGLCSYDSKYRFGYEDVKRWLMDHNYTGIGVDEEWPRPFIILKSEYRDEQSLFIGITQDADHWNEGRQFLYRKLFENFFSSFRPDLARAAQIADETYRDNKDKGLAVFLKNLYAPGAIVWKGYTFSGLEELGNRMVKTNTPQGYGEILQNKCISHWLKNTEGIQADAQVTELVNEMEEFSVAKPEIACYWFGNTFASEKKLSICEKVVSSVEELFDALFKNSRNFYSMNGLSKLMDRKDGCDLYGFLFSFGYRDLIDAVWGNLNELDVFSKANALFLMLENIAVHSGINPSIIREFYVNDGPIGAYLYTQRLLLDNIEQTYIPLDVDGKQIISTIQSIQVNSDTDIQSIFEKSIPLIDAIEKMKRILIDNPFCIETGVYETKGIICANLKGSYAFNMFGRPAPLGYHAWINSENGGV